MEKGASSPSVLTLPLRERERERERGRGRGWLYDISQRDTLL